MLIRKRSKKGTCKPSALMKREKSGQLSDQTGSAFASLSASKCKGRIGNKSIGCAVMVASPSLPRTLRVHGGKRLRKTPCVAPCRPFTQSLRALFRFHFLAAPGARPSRVAGEGSTVLGGKVDALATTFRKGTQHMLCPPARATFAACLRSASAVPTGAQVCARCGPARALAQSATPRGTAVRRSGP